MTNINEPQTSDELAEAKRLEELEASEESYMVGMEELERDNQLGR